MSETLQIVLALVLVALAGFLVPLLVQLRRTAKAMEELAKSTSRDISRVAEDVNHIRVQVEEVTALAKDAMALPAGLGRLAGAFTQRLPSSPGGAGSTLAELLVAGIQAALALFRRPGAGPRHKEESHE
jgi:hypothetical protein